MSNGCFWPETDVRRKILKGCFRLDAVLHPSLGTDWFRRQSGIRHLSTRWQKAVIRVKQPSYCEIGNNESSGEVVPPAATLRTWV